MKHLYKMQNVKVGDKIPLYGAKKIRFRISSGYLGLNFGGEYSVTTTPFDSQFPINFPVIDGKSPLYADVLSVGTGNTNLTVFIDEIGGVPYENYWDL